MKKYFSKHTKHVRNENGEFTFHQIHVNPVIRIVDGKI